MKQLIILLLLLISVSSPGQQAADSLQKRPGAALKIGAFYNSYLHYYGRTDSLQSSGFFPIAEFSVNERFYISAAPVFVMSGGSSPEYAGAVTMAGYRFGKENRSSWNFYLVKPFYKNNSQLVQSALQAQLAGTGTWLNRIMNITLGGDIKLSDKIDFGLQAGIDHIFRKELKGPAVLVIDPSFYANAGTQQFSKTYYKESGFLFFPGMQQEITEKVSQFNVLSYEVSVPLVYARGKMQFILSPSYVIPRNLIGERGRNKFYGLAGARLTL